MYSSGDYYSRSGSGRGGGGGGSSSRDRYERDRVPSRYRSPSPSYDRHRSSSSRYERSPPSRSSRRSPSPAPRYRSGGSSRYRSPSPGPSYGRHGGRDSRSERSEPRRRDSSPDRHDKEERRDRSSDERSERRVPTAEDNRNVLERMEKSFTDGPLDALKRSIKEGLKVKVWTRNYKEVRGICTGFVLAFDKHWNIVMKDVDEVYLKPRKSKTPFLRELKPGESELIPEMAPKVPKEKKSAPEKDDTPMETEKETNQPESGIESGADAAGKNEGETAAGKTKKKRRKKRKTPLMCKRHIPKVFIRGDNVVMVALTSDATESRPEQSGDEDA